MSITYTTARRKKICDYALRYGKMKAYELYGASRSSINRWLKRYDGTKASLKDYSRRPKSHPNQSTSEEVKLIVDLWHKNKEFGLDYLYRKLKREHRYKSGSLFTLKHIIKAPHLYVYQMRCFYYLPLLGSNQRPCG